MSSVHTQFSHTVRYEPQKLMTGVDDKMQTYRHRRPEHAFPSFQYFF
jgi:hypothetical protein